MRLLLSWQKALQSETGIYYDEIGLHIQSDNEMVNDHVKLQLVQVASHMIGNKAGVKKIHLTDWQLEPRVQVHAGK